MPEEPEGTVNLDALQELCRHVHALLEHREEGLFTWNMMLAQKMKKLHDMLHPMFKDDDP